MSDLWAERRARQRAAVEPLALRMRPRTLDEFVGQAHVVGPGTLLRRMLEADRITSLLLWGPPGSGKNALAEVIAAHSGRHFERANATSIGVAEIRRVLEEATGRLEDGGQRTILFLDEIHRFSRAQQDVLLGDVERGVITLIGATTENPFFAVNGALLSRSTIVQLEPLSEDDIATILGRALEDPRGVAGVSGAALRVEEEAIAHWARMCDGDARRALTALEVAVLSQERRAARQPGPGPAVVIDLAVAEESIQRKALAYDRDGDQHYDVASAFIKSMRASDADAAIGWLARMLAGGEDPRFVARRIAILASEDIGNADPQALLVAAAAWAITERVGMPECQLALAQATIYMAQAPKSNASAQAIWSAMKSVREARTVAVPRALRDAHYPGAAALGHGAGYVSPHEQAGAGESASTPPGEDPCPRP
jgi:putative ATPase